MFWGTKLLSLVFFILPVSNVLGSIKEEIDFSNTFSPHPCNFFDNKDNTALNPDEETNPYILLEKIGAKFSFLTEFFLVEGSFQTEAPSLLSLPEVEESLGISPLPLSDSDEEAKQPLPASKNTSSRVKKSKKQHSSPPVTKAGQYKLHEGWLLLINEITSATLPSLQFLPQGEGKFKKDRSLKARCYNTIAAVVRSWLRKRPEYAIYSVAAEEEFWNFSKKRRPRSHSLAFKLVNPRENTAS